jgi:hypothetical protein
MGADQKTGSIQHSSIQPRSGCGKGKHKIPPTYARAEECARSLYGRRDDDGFDGIRSGKWTGGAGIAEIADIADIEKGKTLPLMNTDGTDFH